MEKKKKIKNRRWHMKPLRGLLKIFIRKPKVLYLGEPIEEQSIILSNHVGSSGPLTLECYFKDQPFRFWGTYEMNGNLKMVYKYLSEVFYHQKKGWNLTLAKMFCLIAAPLVKMFYAGLNLISTYPDMRFKGTLQESKKTLKSGQSLIIFPEDSSKGYFDELTSFYSGFAVFANMLYKKGVDLPIYASYLNRKTRVYVVSEKMMFSELIKDGFDREELAKRMLDKVNGLREYTLKEKDKTEKNEKPQ